MQTTLKKVLTLFCCVSLAVTALPMQAANLSQRPDVQAFIQTMVKEDNFNASYLNRLFDKVELQPKVIALISHPTEAKDWQFYRNFFITDERVSKGYLFWQKHYRVLENLQQQYGIPASVIVAILGVETFYGERQGDYRVMDALTTLAFEYPPREKFFRRELAEYLRLVRDHHLAPMSLKGSYAGAIGMPQFMPSSYRHYAITYKGTHYINLQKNENDIMASVANYLKENGWQRGQPRATKVIINKKSAVDLLKPNVPPTQTLGELRALGLQVDSAYADNLKANIVLLSMPQEPLYDMGFNNFYTIMRYNASVNYAMAVYILSNTLEQCWQEKLKSCNIA
ncbi:MAG: lytic transglycosylase [Gammaproteobacteria bacterium]|jgi:membrane-bound lytic murein transglycosylase B|nr:lytic transglycosylase [Gammaproteobacteria bacterium]